MRNKYILIFLLSIMLLLWGCSGSPEKISIGIIPAREPERMLNNFEPVRAYLEKEIGIPVTVTVPDNYFGLIESMNQNKVDIGFLGPFSYVTAEKQIDLEPLLFAARKDTGTSYHSLIIARKDAGIRTIEDLKGKKFAFVDPGSTSGFIIPSALFKSRDIDVNQYFSKTIYSGSHDSVVMDVLNKKVDAGAVADMNLRRVMDYAKIGNEEFIAVWKSDDIPGSPIVARADLDNTLKEKFITAMLLIHEKDPQAIKYFDSNIEKYVATDKSIYNGVRNIANILGEEFVNEHFLQKNQ
ncbi:phosphonate ABC transporter phosphate-binding periplasmic component [Desulfocucumis palustris]|uniref:Phosphonate ABC transporter phosphate-binding periplasmic component n=1 Tax=Desulfocucumis palustris TaxID=1898651 RepID=A0A2L2XEQ6_9FIRM|nr:phosphonate ABC transporter substrate-binding protein [Desulfocucumis palustris]GBF34715.1 phosphonate ABC transporter phosphate-binding periplasmic component [Desulfocucumis palustris]